MMKRGGIRKNNRGDTLILVIGCIALLSVLGIVILAKTVDNQTMKVVERSAQESFFAADSTSAELATVLEAVTLEAIEDAFSDMLVEYTNSGNDATRTERYEKYFETRLSQKLTPGTDSGVEKLLSKALGDPTGGSISNLTITYDNPVVVPGTLAGMTDVISIKNVKMTYSANGTETSITTDINIQAQIPDVTGGFRSSVDCYFSDFAVIADGNVDLKTVDGATVTGNLYTGESLTAYGSTNATPSTPYTLNIGSASKVLVKDTLQVGGGAKIDIDNGSIPVAEDPSIWAGEILVEGGGDNTTYLNTENMSIYVSDDLTIDGKNSEITMTGTQSKYVGFSGDAYTPGLANYEKSSAITINSAKDMVLDLDGLGQVLLTGNSYIHEDSDSWKDLDSGDAEVGILQGESLAYKDMQAMYLVPNDCMEEGHNPVMSDTESATVNFETTYTLGDTTIIWADYLDSTNPIVTRKLLLDNGVTKVTYVYLNFKNETMAAQYADLYFQCPQGAEILERAKHLGTGSKISLPSDTKARGNVLTYDGSATIKEANPADITVLSSNGLNARLAYQGLFTSLQKNAGGTLKSDHKMVANGITSLGDVSGGDGQKAHVTIPHPVTGLPCHFYLYKGDLLMSNEAEYRNMNGILLVKGNVKIDSNVNISGLVLATGKIEIDSNAKFTADKEAVDALLAEDEVAKYFKGFGESEQSYLSSEAVDIIFENWKRN